METHLNRRNESGNGKSLNWGAIGVLLERCWSAIGALLGRFGALWGALGRYWGALGRFGALLGRYWGALGRYWGAIGALLDAGGIFSQLASLKNLLEAPSRVIHILSGILC